MRFAPPTEPAWLIEARKHIGQKEIPGKESNPWIVSLWQRLKGSAVFSWLGSDDSSAPWCGAYVGHCISHAGIVLPQHWYRAKAWLDWGVKLEAPTVGCIVVYERKGGGHVGFVVGKDQLDNIMTLGGNQKDQVSIAPFSRERVAGYRWPPDTVIAIAPLPLVGSDGQVSTTEA